MAIVHRARSLLAFLALEGRGRPNSVRSPPVSAASGAVLAACSVLSDTVPRRAVGCGTYSQTIYVSGRPNRWQGVACKLSGGTNVQLEF